MAESTAPWQPIYEAGIRVRRTPEQARGWDYAIPAIQRDWHGPYPSEAEAVGAAIGHLIQRVQQGGAPAPASESARAAELRHVLENRLHQAQLHAATLGVNAPPAIMLEIEDIKRQLAELGGAG